MKVAFIMSPNIAFIYCTILKILRICYTILFWDTWYVPSHCSALKWSITKQPKNSSIGITLQTRSWYLGLTFWKLKNYQFCITLTVFSSFQEAPNSRILDALFILFLILLDNTISVAGWANRTIFRPMSRPLLSFYELASNINNNWMYVFCKKGQTPTLWARSTNLLIMQLPSLVL